MSVTLRLGQFGRLGHYFYANGAKLHRSPSTSELIALNGSSDRSLQRTTEMEPPAGNAPASQLYQSRVLLLYYGGERRGLVNAFAS